MFTTISKPFDPWPTVWGLIVVSGALGLVFFFQVFWPQMLKFQTLVPNITTFHMIRLTKPRSVVAAVSRGRKEKLAVATEASQKNAHSPTASIIPGTPQWRQHVDRGHSLDFEIVAEESLPVLRANGVSLAMDVHRPRGNTLLYDLRNRTLTRGVVADDVVVREVEGLPAEFDEPLREAERELGARPRVWALYSNDLFSALRSLTHDVLQQEAVPMDSVKTARVRLSLVGGRAFAVTLLSHY
jgi:hypothetical protein